jgi:hypothetical protein
MSFQTAFFAFFKGEKSQAELETYRRASRQIDDLEAAIQTQVLAAPARGAAPWDRPAHYQQAMAFAWIARAHSTICSTLMEIDAKEDPATAGYLPVVTFGQIKELYVQVPDVIHSAWEALANPRYQSSRPLPLPLGPRIEASGKCPLVHMKGIQAAAKALDDFGQARLNSYLASLQGVSSIPAAVEPIVAQFQQIRARAQSKLTFANDQLAAIATGQSVPLETHEAAETRLWEALSDHFMLGQFLAMPKLLENAATLGHNAAGRTVPKEDRWFIAEKDAAAELKNTKFGEQEIKEFWVRKGWRTTPREERYLVQCQKLLAEHAISVVSRWSTCPFDPVYLALQPINLLDTVIERGREFHLNMDEHEDNLLVGNPKFRRTAAFEEEHEEGHHDDKVEG